MSHDISHKPINFVISGTGVQKKLKPYKKKNLSLFKKHFFDTDVLVAICSSS